MAHRGRVRNGVVVLEEPVTLPEGAEVRVELAAKDQEDSSLEAKYQELVASWKAKSRFISSPVSADVRGNVAQMRDLWLRWGRAEGYRW